MASSDKNILDDPRSYSSLDPSGLGARIASLPNHCRAAWKNAGACSLPSDWSTADKVVIGGMGGSAMAGELAADLAAGRGALPILVVRDPSLPFALDRRTLFIACSYSGNTEETLSLFDQAMSAQAMTLVVSGGGRLAQKALDYGVPLLTIDIATEPRSAVGYNLMLILAVLRRAGLLEIGDEEASGAVDAVSGKLAALGHNSPLGDNPAKGLALGLKDKLILVYGSGLFSGMARRWKTQLNENAKVWAYFETVPELLHNSVEAYPSLFPMAEGVMALLLQPAIGDSGYGGPNYGRHNKAVSELLRLNNLPHRVVLGDGAQPLAQLLSMLQLGDYVSYYLAMLQGVDPSPNPAITAAKKLLETPPGNSPNA